MAIDKARHPEVPELPDDRAAAGLEQAGPPPLPSEPPGFYRALPRALKYPLTGKGVYLLAAGAVCLLLAELAAFWVSGMLAFSIIGLAVTIIIRVVITGYLCAYMIAIVASVAGGDPEPPNWPDPTNLLEDVVLPFLYVLGALVIAYSPFIVYGVVQVAAGRDTGYDAVRLLLSPRGIGLSALQKLLLLLPLLYAPMSLLSVALHDSFAGLNPALVLPAIIRASPAYLLACVAIIAAAFLRYVLGRLLAGVPLLGEMLDTAVFLYFLMAGMFALGLVYRTHEKKLRWFPTE